ncbi:MAG: Cyclic pyranopterin monophosphate synthase [Promethearchaeota archaeon]|nr:MAG: Cyclic pyranopterin monophosphate synthase [Candidatus Lokiarchaeota archaeon]
MTSKIIYVDKESEIPLFGLDFLGIIDRGTNIIELKPITLCNLQCKYCFVSAGSYLTNFIVKPSYLIEKANLLAEIKGRHDLEIHLAPYGEILLYPELDDLIDQLWTISGVKKISMQTNGLLLSPEIIQKLEQVKLSRINISLNTFDKKLAEDLANCQSYDIKSLLKNINLLLDTQIDVLLAPVWFPGVNDKDIQEIIQFVNKMRPQGYSEEEIQLGIQKYLTYKTGRRLRNIHPKTWGYFYQKLSMLEDKYNLKLKLGPHDFGIHSRKLYFLELQKGDAISVKITSPGRWQNEAIGKINDQFAAKVLLNSPVTSSTQVMEKEIKVKILRTSPRDNIITAFFPPEDIF